MMTHRDKLKTGTSLGLLLLTGIVQAGASLQGNIAVTTNYIWRGVSQSDDQAAVSSGLDYTHTSGWYAGGWTSSLNGSNAENHYELDLYFGYRFQAGPLEWDVGYIDYRYPVGTAPTDFGEFYINAGNKIVTGGLAYSIRTEHNPVNKNNLYGYLGADFGLKRDLHLKLLIGHYEFDDPTRVNYTHREISLRKGEFSFTFHKTTLSGEPGDTRWSGSWRKNFDLY